MAWNYRVFKSRQRKTFPNGHRIDETSYSIRSTYYDDPVKETGVGWSVAPASPDGNNVAELRSDLITMLGALRRPIIIDYKRKQKSGDNEEKD